MKYRWDKGKKGDVNKLPNGDQIIHITVGGRTSAIVPNVQRLADASDSSGSEADVDDEEEAEQRILPSRRRAPTRGTRV